LEPELDLARLIGPALCLSLRKLHHMVSCDGIQVVEAKIDKFRSWLVPTSVIAARSFHDLTSF